MTKTKIWLIAATVLILIGAILFVGIMTALKWDFGKLSTTQFESNNYSIEEDFNSISINSTTAIRTNNGFIHKFFSAMSTKLHRNHL